MPPQPHGGTLPKGRRVAINTLTLRLLSGWKVVKKERTDVILANTSSDGTGFLYLLAGVLNQPTTAQNLLDGTIAGLQKQYPDANLCGSPASYTVGGVAGTLVSVCYTFTPQGGSSFPAVSLLWGATNGTGKTIYFFHAQLAADNKAFVNNLIQLLRTVTWTVS